jgi:hypothetical protein
MVSSSLVVLTPCRSVVSDIVTRWPPGTGTTESTLVVWRPFSPLTLAVVWYTQVFPTAMGYRGEPVTDEFDVATGVALRLALALDAVADDVLPEATFELLADAPHPASATTAVPTRTARADRNLLI